MVQHATIMSYTDDDPTCDTPIHEWKNVLHTCIHGIGLMDVGPTKFVHTPSQSALVSYLVKNLVKANRKLMFCNPHPSGYVAIRVVSLDEKNATPSTLWVEVGPLDLRHGTCDVMVSKRHVSRARYVKQGSQRCAACDKLVDCKK